MDETFDRLSEPAAPAPEPDDETKLWTDRQIIDVVQTIAGRQDLYSISVMLHQKRTALLAKTIAEELTIPRKQVLLIYMAGLVHDIGKLFIPPEILNKRGPLTETEFDQVKKHSRMGAKMLRDAGMLETVIQLLMQHHERLDGSGYPQGLKGDEILPGARILAVADAMDGMMTARIYRPSLGVEKSLNELVKDRGIKFDAEIVDICVRLFTIKKYKLESATPA